MRGVWIQAANDRPDDMPEEHRINMLLAGMEQADREVLARMLASAFEDGVFITLRVLHDHSIAPFDDGYEGTPFNDFVGRLNDWPWPTAG